MDSRKSLGPILDRNVVDITEQVRTPLGYDSPEIKVNIPGVVVIFKPAGWETDVYDVEKYGIPLTQVARYYLLSSYLAGIFSRAEHPICHDVLHGFGFVHRLDQMSSGLIATTTTYSAHRHLQLQMCTYRIDREYIVLGHAFLRPAANGPVIVRARILEGAVRARSTFGDRCRVDARGKPACSRVSVESHLWLAAGEEPLGLVAISIFTGRQHQIRVHLQYLGAPSVYDGRYTEQGVLLRGARLADVARAPAACPLPRALPERHKEELALRGAYPWR